MSSFLALDFETANERRDSPCALGVVKVVDDQIVDEWETLIDPQGPFTNTWIHGISADHIVGAPLYPDVLERLMELADETTTIVAHNASFDVQVLTRTAARYGLDFNIPAFACTMVMSRRWFPGWPTYALSYAVRHLDLAESCGDAGHHNALWDARAAAHIALAGLKSAGVDTWQAAADAAHVALGSASAALYRGCGSRWSHDSAAIRPVRDPGKEVDPDHPLHEVSVCFTGTLSHLSRREAAQLVVDTGGEFTPNVTKKTDLLVVGQQDLEKLAGHTVSSKMRKAATMAADGHHIEIIDERDLHKLLMT